MKYPLVKTLGLLGFLFLSACSISNLEPADTSGAKNATPLSDPGMASRTIPNSYIIVLKENAKYRGNLTNVKAKGAALMKAQGQLESNIYFITATPYSVLPRISHKALQIKLPLTQKWILWK